MNAKPVFLDCKHVIQVGTLTTTAAAAVEDGTKTTHFCGKCLVQAKIVPPCRCGHGPASHVIFGNGCSASTGHGASCRCSAYRPYETAATNPAPAPS